MSVLKLRPHLRDYIWGGTRLRDEFGKDRSYDRIAESWELSCLKDSGCIIASGRYSGCTLGEYIEIKGRDILGSRCKDTDGFPLLIKLIDAKLDLSVQVHPDDEYASKHEGGLGKTEMWLVIDCEEDAQIIYGLKEGVSKADLIGAIDCGRLPGIVNRVPVKKGDVFFIPAGTLHAIGKGILIAEIQQNSDTTYRVYDYGRLGADGRPRELHIQKAVDVIDTAPPKQMQVYDTVRKNGFGYRLLVSCEYFTAAEFSVESSVSVDTDSESFSHLMFIDGCAEIIFGETLTAHKGDSFFIEAGSGTVTVSGRCSFILTRTGCEEGIDKLVKG